MFSSYITLYFISLQVEVLQGVGDHGDGGQVVIRKVQLHQAGRVEDIGMDAAVLQATAT